MRSVIDLVGPREAWAEPVTVGDVTVTPRSRALVVRWPRGGFIWNRPTAVLVERDGHGRHIPIVDVTRILQLGLLAVAVVTAVASLRALRQQMGEAA